jgi:UDP-N-acetylmuramyl pentapeptide phosphotransferase/UDP-N-acetylglucosamine-1-phosphate transferase
MFLLASGALLVVGVADDGRGLKPWVKLAGQSTAAFIVLGAGWSFQMLLGHELPMWLDVVLTVGWILFFINAFNLIDGLDGLSTGLGIIAAIGMAGALLVRKLPGDALVLAAFVGACAAFLRFNFHPASVFLGDSGSMFIGFFLASVALGTGSKGTVLVSVGGPLLAAGVPVFDVMLTLWRRSLAQGEGILASSHGSFLCADMDHIHHRLLTKGIGQRRVAVCLYAANVLLIAMGLLSLFYATLAVSIFLLAFVAGGYVLVKRGILRDRAKDLPR